MKKIIVAIIAITAGTFTSTAQEKDKKVTKSEEKVVKEQNNVDDANKDLDKAKEELAEDVKNYKKQNAEKLAANDKNFAEFKARIEVEKKAAKDDYNKRIIALDEKNNDLKLRMANYHESNKENWESFKKEYNHDMDELGKAFKDLTIDNSK